MFVVAELSKKKGKKGGKKKHTHTHRVNVFVVAGHLTPFVILLFVYLLCLDME